MSIQKNALFKELLNNFLALNKEVEAIIVSDEEGFVIAGEKRKDIDIEIVSFLTAVVHPILDRIRNEFSFQKFGTASFDTDEHRLLFISVDELRILSLVLEMMGSIEKISPYAYFLAEKTAQILSTDEVDSIELTIPDFEYKPAISETTDRLKDQLYTSKLDQGKIYRFKFIIIGDHEVGKTSIVRRFIGNKFLEAYRATIGLNVLTHNFEAFGNKVFLALWDIGAQQFFKRYRKTYYKDAQAVFIVFDLTNPESFENVTKWHNELKEFIENKDLPIIIVGNKKDMINEREISYEEGVKLASDLSKVAEFSAESELSDFSDLSEYSKTKISYIETSALSGEYIQEAFTLISYHYMIKSKEIEESRLKNEVLNDILSILEDKRSLTLTFLTEDPLWSPGLQILTEIKKLGEYSKVKDKKKEKLFRYANGLILKNYTFESFKISEADGVFCTFDASEKEHIDPKWNEIIIKIIKDIQKNKVILIGIKISEKIDWSQFMEEFDVYEKAERKMLTLLFFVITEDYRLEISTQLGVMLNTIRNLIYSY